MTSFTGLSFIIAHRETDDINSAVNSIKSGMKSQNFLYEIVSVSGNHPTHQRNFAAQEAKYSHLYFLDDDVMVNHKSIKILINIIKSDKWKGNKISLIGGPALLQQPASFIEECVDSVLSSGLVVGKIKSRYSQVGKARFSDDREMILCNLMIEKNHFNQLDKFDTKLYPNEENDFISRLLFFQKENNQNYFGKVIYHPEIYITRPQRKTIGSFISQMLAYGRGRAEQTKNSLKTLHLHLLLSIPFFLFFILMFIMITLSFFLNNELLKSFAFFLDCGKMVIKNFSILYIIYTLLIFTKASLSKRIFLFYIPFLILCCHFFYGMGMALGFIQKGFRVDKKKVRYKINKINF